MFISVKLLRGWQKIITYRVPEQLISMVKIGTLLQVPLRNNKYPAIVLALHTELPIRNTVTIKELSSIHTMPLDPNYHSFVSIIQKIYFLPPHYIYQRLYGFFNAKPPRTLINQETPLTEKGPIKLNEEQKIAIATIEKSFQVPEYQPHLLQGVTGSGKTIVYKELIEKMLLQKKSILFLVPEVNLAFTFLTIFKQLLPNTTVLHSFHSANKINEKKELWHDLCTGNPIVIIGVHLPIIIPIEKLGLIIVDEEHEQGYQEKKHPKFHSKELAILRAKTYKIPIVLGSATPSIQTLYTAKKEAWPIVKLTKRFNQGALPTIEKISLLTKEKRTCFWLSNRLVELIHDRLHKKEQTILFINRRGYSFFTQCKECGFVFQCTNCSVSLTVHIENEKQYLSCHYCSLKKPIPTTCPSCHATEKSLLTKGIGTQKLLETLSKMLPDAKIARADLDITKQKKTWQETVQKMESGHIDILIGTQSITKGYHFPRVTLVGIIWADLHLHMPSFSAAERTLQQLLQVAGRAGRASEQSTVIVQYMQEAELFKFLKEEDYEHFYALELAARKEPGYPPHARLISIELYHTDEAILDEESEWAADFLNTSLKEKQISCTLLGPAKPIVYKIKNLESRQIFLKTERLNIIYPLLKKLLNYDFSSKIQICPTQS